MSSDWIESVYDSDRLSKELAHLQVGMEAAGCHDDAHRVADLAGRLQGAEMRVRVALCGLFSAGKSSLINALTGDAALATGAVPTTAVVEEVVWETPGGALVLMDTPGIDSTDDAHQAATDAAMHLADVVLLVVDYQHVESEENLELARLLTNRGKRLMVVVNQVDKHLDAELQFDTFADRVVRSLDDEGIVYDRVFYTSSRQSTHNQIDVLRSTLQNFADEGENFVRASVVASAQGLITEAVDGIFADREWSTDSAMLDVWGRTPLDVIEAQRWQSEVACKLADRAAEITQRQADLITEWETAEEGFERSVELAQIAPYSTTELGRIYIESLRKDFKVGWIGAQRKTDEERDRRILAFSQELQQNLRQNLVWPLQRELRAFANANGSGEPSWLEQIDHFTVDITLDDLREPVHQGAIESRQYPYQYVKDVVGRVKAGVRRELHAILAAWQNAALGELAEEATAPSDEWRNVQAQAETISNWISVRSEKSRRQTDWRRGLTVVEMGSGSI